MENMKILIVNGPNINMLGTRETDIYGTMNYSGLVGKIKAYCDERDVCVDFFQSNCEGEIVTEIQKAYGKYDGIIINPAAYTHTSIAILDALQSVGIRTVEVHISDIGSREDFRKFSYVSIYAEKTISGHGTNGYIEAVDYLLGRG